MTALAHQSSSKRRLLLASDRSDQSRELAGILQSVGEVDSISTSDIPDAPARHFAGMVVDINLRSGESVQRVRSKLRAEAYRSVRGCSFSRTPFTMGRCRLGHWEQRIRYRGRSMSKAFCSASARH